MIRQLHHYRGKAPYYESTLAIVKDCLRQDEVRLSRLNTTILERLCDHLGLRFNHAFLSELQLSLGPIEGPGDWALRVCQALRADTYVNATGGRARYDAGRFADQGVSLRFQESMAFQYECDPYGFTPGLSIIDVCMWNSCERLQSRWRTLETKATEPAELSCATALSRDES